MKKILWISRHVMTKEQLEGLARLYGEFEVEIYAGTVESMGQLKEQVENCDVVAAVLPALMLSELVKMADGRPVMQAVSGRVRTGRKIQVRDGVFEEEYEFRHLYWQEIKRMEMEVVNYE